MASSKCTLSSSLWATAPSIVVCCWIYTTTRGSSGHKSHTFCSFCVVAVWRDLFCCCLCVVGLVFLFFVAPFSLLAVFRGASVFNQDVSNWNTSAVIDMSSSKCTLSPSLWPRLPLLCILNIRQLECHLTTILTRSVILLLCYWNGTFFVVCGGFGLSVLCCTLLSSCSVQWRICV